MIKKILLGSDEAFCFSGYLEFLHIKDYLDEDVTLRRKMFQ